MRDLYQAREALAIVAQDVGPETFCNLIWTMRDAPHNGTRPKWPWPIVRGPQVVVETNVLEIAR